MRQTYIIAAAAALPAIAMATPASALLELYGNVDGSVITCSDGAACDINPAPGILEIAPTTLNGVFFTGEIAASTSPGGPDILNNSVLDVINTTGVTKHLNLIVSDTGFAGPVSEFAAAGSGTWQNTIGSSITLNWFADPANAQGADGSGSTPGTLLTTFSNTATSIVQSFSNGTAIGPFVAAGPASLTMQATYDLDPFGQLINRGMTVELTAVPEPSTWMMLALGFVGLGYAAVRRSAKDRSALAI